MRKDILLVLFVGKLQTGSEKVRTVKFEQKDSKVPRSNKKIQKVNILKKDFEII